MIRFGKHGTLTRPDLNRNWRDIDYCAIDVETTGLDLEADEIVAIGAVQIHQGRIQTENNFYSEVQPRRLLSKKSVEIHGLRAVDLEVATPIESVIPELARLLKDRVLIAHAAWVEKGFLERHLAGTGTTFSKQIIDTAALARTFGYASEESDHEPSLEFLARRMHLPVYAPHHALGDALTTAVVFLAQATELERVKSAKGVPMLTLRALLDASIKKARR